MYHDTHTHTDRDDVLYDVSMILMEFLIAFSIFTIHRGRLVDFLRSVWFGLGFVLGTGKQ